MQRLIKPAMADTHTHTHLAEPMRLDLQALQLSTTH
jgi:hypothetical protein